MQFCLNHYDLWCELRQVGYIEKWEFFETYEKTIRKCNDCKYNEALDFYSLYFLSIANDKFPDAHFNFHIPYPIGIKFLPKKYVLKQVQHNEQEGMFRFGRTLYEEEKILFSENTVIRHYEEARKKFQMYFK